MEFRGGGLAKGASLARTAVLGWVVCLAAGCAVRPQAPSAPVDEPLAEVARIHGGAGPWAVAGYRMGEYALHALGLSRGSFDLDVVHFTPPEVQYSCVADGAAASTGASVGKLNLKLADAPAAETRTLYRNKSTGASLVLRVTQSFAARFTDVPRERLARAGREVMQMRDAEIFQVER